MRSIVRPNVRSIVRSTGIVRTTITNVAHCWAPPPQPPYHPQGGRIGNRIRIVWETPTCLKNGMSMRTLDINDTGIRRETPTGLEQQTAIGIRRPLRVPSACEMSSFPENLPWESSPAGLEGRIPAQCPTDPPNPEIPQVASRSHQNGPTERRDGPGELQGGSGQLPRAPKRPQRTPKLHMTSGIAKIASRWPQEGLNQLHGGP